MGTDPLSGCGLRSVELTDRATINSYFKLIQEPLSDYTFSQLYSWSNSLRILWKEIEGHLCVFANGSGDLTLLMPPIGDGGADRALAACWELMHQYNTHAGCPEQSRVEYASDELLARLDRSRLEVVPQGVDYVYDTARMIDLAGGDLASKRQLRSRFMRNYAYRVETYDPARHADDCLRLLDEWKHHQDESHAADPSTNALKRQKETIATRLSLLHAAELGYKGMVVYVQPRPEALQGQPPRWEGMALRGFTFGEHLGSNQASIVIEKTDLQVKGLAQFIFSEFCRTAFADRPFINAGDDWGLESLAWTKMSYRPIKLMQKYVVKRKAAVAIVVPDLSAPAESLVQAAMAIANEAVAAPVAAVPLAPVTLQPAWDEQPEPAVRPARPGDIAAAVELEASCFSAYSLNKRQLQYLQTRSTAVFLVAEDAGRVVGEAIGLVRHHKKGLSGRIYSLAVHPECRGRKIGQKLMQRMIDELSMRGVRRIYLEVEGTNQAAIRLYERLGFRSIGVLPAYYGEGRDGVHMMYDAVVTTRTLAA